MRVILTPDGIQEHNGWAEVAWTLSTENQKAQRLVHAVPERLAPWLPDPEQADHVVCASLLHAMRLARERNPKGTRTGPEATTFVFHAEGSLSPRLLEGLETLQEIWTRWRPNRYAPVRLTAAREQAAPPAPERKDAIFAFSGGVDASFSLGRHLSGFGGRNRRTPDAVMVVHGMDIPLEQPERFQSVLDRARGLLEAKGVDVAPVRSNTRVLKQPWEDSYGLQLISCFLLFQSRFSHSLHGSGESYEDLVLPWGTTPLTDHLPSTELMDHHMDGAHFDRTEKVAWLARNPEYLENLRVCWQGPELDRNCGRCEKCIRTKLNFWATGNEIPRALPGSLTPDAVGTINADNSIKLRELQSVYRHATARHAASDPLLRALRRKITGASLRKLVQVAREVAAFAVRGR